MPSLCRAIFKYDVHKAALMLLPVLVRVHECCAAASWQ